VSIGQRTAGLGALAALLATGCAGEPAAVSPPSQWIVAPLATEDCDRPPTTGLPAEVDAVVVRITGADGTVVLDQRIEGDALGEDSLVLPGVPAAEGLRLALFACVGDEVRLATRSAPFDLGEDVKRVVPLRLHVVGQPSCAGTGRGVSYDRYATMGRPRAFAAAAPLPDGRLLVAGGAGAVGDDVLSADAGPEAWDVYDPADTLFLPGPDRSAAPGPRSMLAPRVGARAVPVGGGVLVVGGAPALAWGDFAYGPLRPVGAQVSDPPAEFFGGRAFGPVTGSIQGRVLPAVARDPQTGAVVIAGGLRADAGGACEPRCPGRAVDCPDSCDGAPSDAVEVVTGTTLRNLTLDRPRVGATVTAIGGGRFLVWGGDVGTCGAQPAALIDLAGPTVRPLGVEADEAPPACGNVAAGCRSWWPTAWHAAALLPPRDGTARVLIVGGVAIGGGRVLNNPDLGGADCRPNAFVVEVPPEADRAVVRPADVPDAVRPALKRGFPGASFVGDRVLVTGGWAVLRRNPGEPGTPTAIFAGDEAVFYRDAAGATAGTFAPAGWTLSVPRLGHVAETLDDGTVLLAGGLFRDVANETGVSRTAEVFVPTPPGDICRAPPLEP
jgi:hypothetical protein